LRRALGVPLNARQVGSDEFDELLSALYNAADVGAAALAGELAQDLDLSRLLQEIPRIEDLLESRDDAPVIRLINALLTQALREEASDIHIEPFETRSVVRLRIDGTLRDLIEPARALHAAIVSRVKIMAQLDIAEKRLPQDGRITLRVAGKPVDVRVSTIPTGHGERVVLRLLDKQAGRLDLTHLGMDDTTLAHIDRLIRQPHGIVLVTGPTGSGKTTTLYAALSRLDATALNIMTVEDPIEYDLDGISQTQVNPRIEMSFARALRTILRQDPDVVMIGEIRDLETAQIVRDAAHQRRGERGDAARRHGRGALPAGLQPDRSGRPAPGAPAVPGMPQALRRRCRTTARPGPGAERRHPLFSAGLQCLQGFGLSRPHRHLRTADSR
jgi:general secretion pathway protein E